MCSKLTIKEVRTTSTTSLFFTLSLTLPILVSLLLTLNIFHILNDVKNAENYIGKKKEKVSLTDCKLKCFSLKYKPLVYKRIPLSLIYRQLQHIVLNLLKILFQFLVRG